MKVIGIIASPRGKASNTLQLMNGVLKGAREEGAATELVDIYSLDIGYCTACGNCYVSGDCTLFDDFPALFDTLMDADGVVLGAPNYIDSIPAPLKAMFDRMADAIHCQMFYGKYGCSVCTAGGGNHGPVVEYEPCPFFARGYHGWGSGSGHEGWGGGVVNRDPGLGWYGQETRQFIAESAAIRSRKRHSCSGGTTSGSSCCGTRTHGLTNTTGMHRWAGSPLNND